jgi:hypothetical protein
MTAKNQARLIALLVVAVPILIFIGFLISEIIKPTPISLSAPTTNTNQIQAPR